MIFFLRGVVTAAAETLAGKDVIGGSGDCVPVLVVLVVVWRWLCCASLQEYVCRRNISWSFFLVVQVCG